MGYIVTLQNVAHSEFVVPFWEVAFFAAVITLYAFLGRRMSCLINTFAFTFYWGFLFMVPAAFAGNGLGKAYLSIYLVSGLVLYATVTLSDLPALQRAVALFSVRRRDTLSWHWKFSYDKTGS
jgi:predicted membrane protein